MQRVTFVLTTGDKVDVSYSPAININADISVVSESDGYSVMTNSTPAVQIADFQKVHVLYWFSDVASAVRE